jgi:hypothetical protein
MKCKGGLRMKGVHKNLKHALTNRLPKAMYRTSWAL